eukprot:11159521-Lingulodinium_polyedra.AAC.1
MMRLHRLPAVAAARGSRGRVPCARQKSGVQVERACAFNLRAVATASGRFDRIVAQRLEDVAQ